MSEAPDKNAQLQAMMRTQMPRIYANGFGLAQSSSDITIFALHNNLPVGMVSMSYISAKSLLKDLTEAIGEIEAALGQSLPTMEEVSRSLRGTKGRPDVE